jgi:hypothetical protein
MNAILKSCSHTRQELDRNAIFPVVLLQMIATEIISKTAKPLSPHPTQLNPNSNWVNFRGAWVTNMVLLVFLRMFFTIIPGISTEIAWTLTNVLFLFVSAVIIEIFLISVGSLHNVPLAYWHTFRC